MSYSEVSQVKNSPEANLSHQSNAEDLFSSKLKNHKWKNPLYISKQLFNFKNDFMCHFNFLQSYSKMFKPSYTILEHILFFNIDHYVLWKMHIKFIKISYHKALFLSVIQFSI